MTNKLTIGWMYPNLLNLHGERGSVQMLERIGRGMGLEIQVLRIEDFDEPIPFDELDLMIFLPGEIETFRNLISGLQKQKEGLDKYLNDGGFLLALGTTGLMFGSSITRENGDVMECLNYLDITAKERKYVFGDDLHVRINGTKQELIGSQILMADYETKTPFGTVLYGRGNNGTGQEGCRWKNLICTNCLGPLFVKNPWFGQYILQQIVLHKAGLKEYADPISQASFDATLNFIQNKPKK